MMFTRSTKGDKSLDERWVEKARVAKRTTFSLEDWSDREIARWNLDDPVRKPTGAKNPTTWRYEKPLRRQNRSEDSGDLVDPRTSPTIGDAEEGAFD